MQHVVPKQSQAQYLCFNCFRTLSSRTAASQHRRSVVVPPRTLLLKLVNVKRTQRVRTYYTPDLTLAGLGCRAKERCQLLTRAHCNLFSINGLREDRHWDTHDTAGPPTPPKLTPGTTAFGMFYVSIFSSPFMVDPPPRSWHFSLRLPFLSRQPQSIDVC